MTAKRPGPKAQDFAPIIAAAESGDAYHAYCLAWWHADGDYVERDPQAARRFFALLAQNAGEPGMFEWMRYLKREGDREGFEAVFDSAPTWRLGAIYRLKAEWLAQDAGIGLEVERMLERADARGDLIAKWSLHRRRNRGIGRLLAWRHEIAKLWAIAQEFWRNPRSERIMLRFEPENPADKV